LNSGGVLQLGKAAVHPIDVGRVSYLSSSGKARTRYFAFQALCGRQPARNLLNPANLVARAFGRRGWTVRLKVDQSFDEIVTITTVTINSGQGFGRPGRLAADAMCEDGAFDITVRTGIGPRAITHIHGRKITAAPVEQTHGRPVAVTLDGQTVGRLPATFEILPRALNVRC